MMKSSLEKVWNYISTVKFTLEKLNRNFPDSKNTFNKYLKWIFENSSTTINAGEVLYRGRIYTSDDKWEKYHNPEKYRGLNYAGYDAKESFVNTCSGWPTQGRMNPDGISCLYTARDIDTCIKELSPGYEELISIADIKVKEDLMIADLSRGFVFGDSKDTFKLNLSLYIQELITQGGNNIKDYIFPQYIAEYCKNSKYDGIAYRSKYSSRTETGDDTGINVAVFNYSKCEPIGSKLYKIQNILVERSDL